MNQNFFDQGHSINARNYLHNLCIVLYVHFLSEYDVLCMRCIEKSFRDNPDKEMNQKKLFKCGTLESRKCVWTKNI